MSKTKTSVVIGEKYNMLTIISFHGVEHKEKVWNCMCDCGNITTATTFMLTKHKKKSCGCLLKKPKEFYIGKKYGKLTVLEELERKIKPSGQKKRMFRCLCDCGNETELELYSLKNKTRSCGCLQKEATAKRCTTHGMSHTRLERINASMKSRCYNKNNKDYNSYGGRGIIVCEEWKNVENFINWALNNGYSEGLTIERIDVNRGYMPDNCTFIKNEKQSENKRNTIWVEYEKKQIQLSVLCKKLNLNYHVIWEDYKSVFVNGVSDKNWFRLVESKYQKPNGDTCINIKTVVFQKGVDGIRKILENRKI